MKNICYNPSWLVALEHPLEKMLRTALIVGIALCALVYLYSVGGTVLNLMARKEATLSSARLQQKVASLEGSYLSLLNSTNADTALALNLVPVTASSYVHRAGATAFALPLRAF